VVVRERGSCGRGRVDRGNQVTLAPSAAVKFANGDRVEVSWLARRADRVAHGALYTVSQPPETGAGGDVLTLERPVTAPAGAVGLVVRRWDGEAAGAAAAQAATLRATDPMTRMPPPEATPMRSSPHPASTSSAPGTLARTSGQDAARLRAARARRPRRPLGAHDCRPTFVLLTELKPDGGACTISVRPGDDLQNAVDSLPATGGELCLAAGVYAVAVPVQIKARSRIVVTGAGPASIIRASGHEAALLVDTSDDRDPNIRVEGGTPSPGGDPALNGAITVTGSSRVRIADCTVACPGAQAVRNQTCITARSGSGRNVQDLRLERNALGWTVADRDLVVDADSARVSGNRPSLPRDRRR
jgi:hypothetical protein